ncbi:MAG: NGG1p interacting factor NIF3 [Sphaerochaetaceae bacterium]
MHILVFYVPSTHLNVVKQALFEQGAGKLGLYDQCSWQTLGTGQFRPLEGSSPYIGEEGAVEEVEEYRVEMVVANELVEAVVTALLASHPYQTVAYHLLKTVPLEHRKPT